MLFIRIRTCNIIRLTHSAARAKTSKHGKYYVPSLKDSFEKYLEYTKPLVSEGQWRKTCSLVSEFIASNECESLQNSLVKRAKLEDNWLSEWWLSSYLTYRQSLVINMNPAIRLKTQHFASDREWLSAAVSMCLGALEYKHILDSDSLETDRTVDGRPLCMNQHYMVLGNCRIPALPHDRLLHRHLSPHALRNISHFCVSYRNRFFRLGLDEPNKYGVIDAGSLYRQLETIVNKAREEPEGPPVGLLTTLPRDQWAAIHSKIRQSRTNASTLSEIERSLFLICLDESANIPADSRSTTRSSTLLDLSSRDTANMINCLHGGGTGQMWNTANRWFDKTVQLILSRDGSVGLNFEHTPSDGHVYVALLNHVHDSLVKGSHDRGQSKPNPVELAWNLDDETMEQLDKAQDALKPRIEDAEFQCATFDRFGSATLKKHKISPDAFIQIALQLAYNRLHPNQMPPPTYESATLRQFELGRTETIRSCSQESVAFCQAMANENSTPQERLDAFRRALNRHQQFTKSAMAGQGFDRHLFGLKMIWSDRNSDPNSLATRLFNDPTYLTANHYRLSTSLVRSPYESATLYGPAVEDGYAFCYNIGENLIYIGASTFKSNTETKHPTKLLNMVAQAMSDAHDLLCNHVN